MPLPNVTAPAIDPTRPIFSTFRVSSGFGRFAGPEGLQALCYPQALVEDRFFSLIRTSIPGPVDYPVGPDSYGFVGGLHHFAFARDWATSARGLWSVITEAVR